MSSPESPDRSGGALAVVEIDGVSIEYLDTGAGQAMLLLHPGFPGGVIEPDSALIRVLGDSYRLICPSHPGFGSLDPPAWLRSVDDLTYLYLDLLASLDLRDVVIVGASLGGWIAAEIAVRSTGRVSAAVLVNPVGIKVGGRDERDIADVFALDDADLDAQVYSTADPARYDRSSWSDEALLSVARARHATARYGWSPYLHNPDLLRRLRRIDIPTLVLEGEDDRILAPGYVEAFAEAIPASTHNRISDAGHFPHIEQPAEVSQLIQSFLGTL